MKSFFLRYSLLFSLLFWASIADSQAQQLSTQPAFYLKNLKLLATKGLTKRLDLGGTFTSMSVQIPAGQTFDNSYLVAANDTFFLRPDAHAEEGKTTSELLIFSQPVTQIIFHSPTISGEIVLTSIYVQPLSKPVFTNTRIADECEKPTVISANTWRAGLTPPKELPVATTVKYIIVHHAAGSNTATNFTEVVRNIYVFHTQSNGWNDVGYNFLIAQDGTIYEGRDGQGKMDGDNVLGAHFCSQNTGTMGICLLGDYMTAQPTQNSLTALTKLIAWKMKKENLDPLGQTLHAGSGKNLMNISGHRDGSCSTDCPGDNLYVKLPQLRKDVPNQCSVLKPLRNEPILESFIKIVPNPSSRQLTLISEEELKGTVTLRNIVGQEVPITVIKETPQRWLIGTESLGSKGIYFLQLNSGGRSTTLKVVIGY